MPRDWPAVPKKRCGYAHCDRWVPPGRRSYCSDSCGTKQRVKAYRERNRDREFGGQLAKVVSRTESKDGRGSMRRGPLYERFIEAGWPSLARENGGNLTHDEIAEQFGEVIGQKVTRVSVTHWLAARVEDERDKVEQKQWSVSDEARARLDDFQAFRSRYFKVGRGKYKGKPPVTTDFHLRWIDAILGAIDRGGQLMILSPPRHGKSLLMTHFVIWQIVRNPDIAIIWVSGSENVAKRFGSTVKDELAHNKLLIKDYLGPHGSFEPSTRSGKQWRDDEFEVATRTIPQPAPTFKAIGRGGTLLSMDADLIVTDDIEDHKRTLQPAVREATRDWFGSDLDSRKEDHTAWVYIGSRQHPQDLASHLLENEEWEAIIETAHDWECPIPESRVSEHVDCVLWPEVRTFSYLMKKKRGSGGAAKFEMQYLNRPRPSGMVYFERATLEACRNPARSLGHRPEGTRLVAGLDPGGGAGFQAVVLWAVDPKTGKRYVVDLENEQAGSTPHMRSVLERWGSAPYYCKDWVIEDNIVADVLLHDEQIVRIKSDLGLVFHPHHTSGANKHDEHLGVTAQIPLYEHNEVHGRRIDLPYGDDGVTRDKVDVFITQHVNFEGGKRSKWAKDDLVMAAWMPASVIKQWLRPGRASRAHKQYRGTRYPRSGFPKSPFRKKVAA